MKKFISGLLIFMMMLLFVPVVGQNTGDKAPDFTIDLLGGGTFKLSDQLGKVVMVYFFGNGCPYCVESGPLVQGIYNTYKGDPDFAAIGLDTWDSSSDVESVTEFRNSTGITFPLALKANFVKTAYAYSYDRIMVIDKMGIIRRKSNVPAINDISGTSNTIQLYLDVSTPVEDLVIEKKRATLYPMPATDRLYADLYLDSGEDVRIYISDITGKERKRMVYALEQGLQKIQVEIDDLEQGVYFYSLQFNGKVETGKILIQ